MSSMERLTISYKRKVKYEITVERLNILINTYFDDFNEDILKKTFIVEMRDMEDVLFLLRYHFRIWITVKNTTITIYKNFPTHFRIIKEVNKDNHWFTPKTFEVGQILYFKNNGYRLTNWLKGIPLCENLRPTEGTEIIATTQINYEFIEAILD
jgi:hypothetical protein